MDFTILNTRPAHQSAGLTELIEGPLGAKCIQLPLLSIKPIHPDNWLPNCTKSEPALIIFTSPNAVHHSLPELTHCWHVMPCIAAIGPATKLSIEQYGHCVNIMPDEANSESLITHPALKKFKNKTVMIVKGTGGRRVLPNFFNQSNGHLIELNVYQRACPLNLAKQIKKIWKKTPIDLILIHSVHALSNLLAQADEKTLHKIKSTTCLTLSHRIKHAALAYGIQNVIAAENDTIDSSIKHYMTHRKSS